MKKILLFAVSIASLLTIAGCKKILEVTPKSQITEQVYFKSEGDFEPYVTGIYTYMRTLANNITYGTERSEELIAASNARFSTAWSQILSPSVGAINYSSWYQAIGQCNLLLAKIKPFSFASDPAAKKRIVAETHALRAYFYFHLMRIIGDCPLMLQAITSADVPLLPRSPATDVMKQVLGDLDTAIVTFPDTKFVSKYRFSYTAAQALKAEASLWNAKVLGAGANGFNDALTAIAEVEKADLSLMPKFRDVNTVRQNKEIILAAYYQRDEAGNNYAMNALPFLTIVQAASNLDSIPWCRTSSNGQGAYQISPLSRSLFTNPNDQRIPSTWILQRNGNTTSYAWITKLPGNVYADDRVPDNDLIIFRLADVYLVAAEAYAGLGQTDNAITYLNKVRERAGTGDYAGATDKATVEREILDERGRELFFENKRWYDLVRFYKGGTIDIYNYIPNLKGKSTPIYWPLNSTVLANNTNLKQTDGY
jgi:hypothetical protein